MRLENATRATWLATKATHAITPEAKARGLIGRTEFKPGEGILLSNCTAVTTAQIPFPIDVLFITRSGHVAGLLSNVQPGTRVRAIAPAAYSVIELPAGMIQATATQIGDRIVRR